MFETPIQALKKGNIELSTLTPFQLYGNEKEFSLVIPRSIVDHGLTVSLLGSIVKDNGIRSEIIIEPLEL